MPISVFGSTPVNTENKIDKSLFVQEPNLRTNYLESNIEEDIDKKNQFKFKKLADPISIREAASDFYVDNKFNDPSIIQNSAHVDFNHENLDNVRFYKIKQLSSHS